MIHPTFLAHPDERHRQGTPITPPRPLNVIQDTGIRELGVLPEYCGQPRMPFSKNNPRLMSPILSIPTSSPFSTTGIRRKFFSPM